MSERDDLGQLLHKIAATVGDPPEHGLERVDVRRRRRTRHRRGAVAAAVALAVVGVAATPWLASQGGEGANLSAVGDKGQRATPSELPDVVDVNCNPTGLAVPPGFGTIRPQRDGLHLAVHNGFMGSTEAWVRSEDGSWDSGHFEAPAGDSEHVQPVPPGVITVGCMIGGTARELRLDLRDVDQLYRDPVLSCTQSIPLEGMVLPRRTSSAIEAAKLATANWRLDEDRIGPLSGYPDEFFSYRTTTPRVRVLRGDRTVAFVYLEDENMVDGMSAMVPWVKVTKVEACVSVVGDQSPTGTATTAPPVPAG